MNFNDLFNGFMNNYMDVGGGQHHHQQQQQQQSKAPPAASSNFIRLLQFVNVTDDDLLEESNKECCVCLESQFAGQNAYKLPCGHLYHPTCLLDWIKRHCTCPCCRYELPTDDAEYEQERKIRMRSRKRRYRKDELKNMKVSQLKEIGRELQIGIGDCLDKDDIITKFVNSGKIDITEGVPLIEITETEMNKKGVGELRKLLLSFGLSDAGALEKSDLRNRLLESGRIRIIIDESNNEKADDSRKRSNDDSNNEDHSNKARNCFTIEKLRTSSVHELKQISTLLSISIIGCIDKQEIVNNIVNSGKVEISHEQAPPIIDDSNMNDYNRNNSEILTLTIDLLHSMSIKEIKEIMNSLGIQDHLCKEKEDLIDTMKKSQYNNKIRIIN